MNSTDLITIDPEILGGAPCFAGTRVPVRTLFDLLERGRTMDDFLEGFPTVGREQVIAVLELARERVVATADAAA
jgi:uncharacterized protein (DUF433 family)